MKKTSLTFVAAAVLAAVIMLTSCVSNRKYNSVVSQRDSLKMESSMADETIDRLTSYLDTLAYHIDSIAVRENIIRLRVDQEGNALSQNELLLNIQTLEGMIEGQRARIEYLEQRLAEAEDSTSSMSRIVRYFRAQIAQKEEEIARLEKEITSKNGQISKLKKQNNTLVQDNEDLQKNIKEKENVIQEREVILSEKDRQLNTAKVRIDSKKDLILDKTLRVTVAGLRVNVSSLDLSTFETVDIRTFNDVTIAGKKAKIMSDMPKGSYEISKENGYLVLHINDVDMFWSVTKYLIVAFE